MFELRDLFQWERFITPSIIKIFYWLALAMAMLGGLQSVFGEVAPASIADGETQRHEAHDDDHLRGRQNILHHGRAAYAEAVENREAGNQCAGR